MDPERLAAALRTQAGWCDEYGSDLYARLLELAAADLEAGGPVARLLADWTGHPNREAVALRMMGGVHHQVLTGKASRLAGHYPSAGGAPAWPDAGDAFLELIDARMEDLRPWVGRRLQTNEVNRSAVLLGGLLEVARRTGRELQLLEIGASGGLNLIPDRYHYHLGDAWWGDPVSPVRLRCSWSGNRPDLATLLVIARRAGCDPHPIDVRNPDDAARLRAFVWADQPERLTRLSAAIAQAAVYSPDVERGRAADWLPDRLADAPSGVATVVMHSVVWHYISREEQAEVTAVIEAAGARAGPERPLAWLHMENLLDVGMHVRLRLWPDGTDSLLGYAHPHGAWVDWRL